MSLLILGAGVFAEEVASLAASVPGVTVCGFAEGRDRLRAGQSIAGLPIYWLEEIGELAGRCEALCAVGSPARREMVEQARVLGIRFTTLIHPSAVLSPTARIGQGCIVGALSVVGASAALGEHVIVNRGCLVGHHASLGDYVTLGPGCNVGGLARIAGGASIGMGALIIDRVTVGENSVVAAGSLVNHDVAPDAHVAGSPARTVRAGHRADGGPAAPQSVHPHRAKAGAP